MLPVNFDVKLRVLMKRVQAGCDESYQQLLLTIKPKVESFIKRRVRNPELAEDAIQMTYLKIHRFKHTFNGTQHFEPWMYSVARSVIIDQFKSEAKITQHEQHYDDLEHAIEDSSNPFQNVALSDALDSVAKQHASIIYLLKIDGMSVKEVAQKIGIKEGAVKVRAHRAYLALKSALEAEKTLLIEKAVA